MNEHRTFSNSDTSLTRPRSAPVRFEIVDAIGRKHGPYKTFAAARAWIEKRFRFQEQDDERSGRYAFGWDISIIEGKTTDRNIRELSLRRLRQVLDYDPETGALMWRIRTGPMCKL